MESLTCFTHPFDKMMTTSQCESYRDSPNSDLSQCSRPNISHYRKSTCTTTLLLLMDRKTSIGRIGGSLFIITCTNANETFFEHIVNFFQRSAPPVFGSRVNVLESPQHAAPHRRHSIPAWKPSALDHQTTKLEVCMGHTLGHLLHTFTNNETLSKGQFIQTARDRF